MIGRIIHSLNDFSIEFKCQQPIHKGDGSGIFLVDLLFPQLRVYLEVDEPQHTNAKHRLRDIDRTRDIFDTTGFEEIRLPVNEGMRLEDVNTAVDAFVMKLRDMKQASIAAGSFETWDYDRALSARPHLERGFIGVGPDAAFRTAVEALKCFGFNGRAYMRGAWTLPVETVELIGGTGSWCVWFPRLYPHAGWLNQISDDGMEILEQNADPMHSYVDRWDTRIVMARKRDELNRTLYRFMGVFDAVPEFKSGNRHLYQRVRTEIATVRPESLSNFS